MSRIITTFCQWHYGDNLLHLNFLRRLAVLHPDVLFRHHCDPNQHGQIRPVIEDIPNIQLDGAAPPKDAINAWINTGASHVNGGWDGKGAFDRHEHRWDYVNYYLWWFGQLAKQMGFEESPIKSAYDMLFDCPCIQKSAAATLHFDVLVINSRPASGQLRCYNHPLCMDPLIDRLVRKGHRVAATSQTNIPGVYQTASNNLTLVDIANLSLRVKWIVGVSTGPDWLTHSIWNVDTCKRILLLDRQRVHLPGIGWHVESFDEAARKLQEHGAL